MAVSSEISPYTRAIHLFRPFPRRICFLQCLFIQSKTPNYYCLCSAANNTKPLRGTIVCFTSLAKLMCASASLNSFLSTISALVTSRQILIAQLATYICRSAATVLRKKAVVLVHFFLLLACELTSRV
jgi:hypothetical protein